MESRATRSSTVDPRTSLAMWLRAGRAQRKLTLDDVARVTKIQPRILEKIEAGNLEGLPAEVFVRGFVKSFARCVGLDEGEAVERYGQCAFAAGTPTSSVARAFVETLVAAPKASDAKAAPSMLEAPPVPEIFPESSMELAPVASADHDVEIVIEAEPTEEIPVQAAPIAEVVETAVTTTAIEVVAVEEIPAAPTKKKRTRKKASGTDAPPVRSRRKKAQLEATPEIAMPVEIAPPVEVIAAPVVADVAEVLVVAEAVAQPEPMPEPVRADGEALVPANVIDTASAASDLFGPPMSTSSETEVETISVDTTESIAVVEPAAETITTTAPWQPTMPVAAPSVPWKRPAYAIPRATPSFTLPTLVIDDADPDLADREREDRELNAKQGPNRVSFLPPILLDREDKSSRQGGLTLAVILLLIAATLTLSYLMRRPSVSGDGVTQLERVDTPTLVA
jgi:hypothetical protein